MNKRIASVLSLVLVLTLVMTGCSSGSSKTVSLGVAVAAMYVDDAKLTLLKDDLTAAFPDMNNEETAMSIQSIPTGDPEGDPMSAMAGMTKISAMMAAGEIDILICDPDNARRHGDNGETYVALDQLFTEEEIAELGITGVTLPVVDEETSELTGEQTHAVGVDLSGNAKINELFLIDSPAAYVIVSTKNLENAREVIKYLLTME